MLKGLWQQQVCLQSTQSCVAVAPCLGQGAHVWGHVSTQGDPVPRLCGASQQYLNP